MARSVSQTHIIEPNLDTPLWKQYQALKDRHAGAILFFRLGDFYEMFGDDARAAAPVLGLVLTQRQGIAMCGVPAHAASGHVAKLLKTGLKVAIADQVEDPALAKGLVRREVTRVITPGTVVEDVLLDPATSNYLAAVEVSGDGWGLAAAEVSTGRFWAIEVPRDPDFRALAAALAQTRPTELLLLKGAWERPKIKDLLPSGTVVSQTQPSGAQLDGGRLRNSPLARKAAAAVAAYVSENEPQLALAEPELRSQAGRMQLDDAAIRTLELVESEDGPSHTLWGTLDRCRTPMGRRLLKEWLLSPLTEAAAIRSRLDAVQRLVEDGLRRSSLQETLHAVPDVERILSRVVTRRTHPKELAALRGALARLPALAASEGPGLGASESEALAGLHEMLAARLADDPPVKLADGGAIRESTDPELDQLRALRTDSRSWLLALEARERERTGIPSLKVSYNSVFGYFIEVTKTHSAKVPADYARKQTLANAERYITEELKALETRILGAEDGILRRESALFEELRAEVQAQAGPLSRAALWVAGLDVTASLAECAETHGYVRPEVLEGAELSIEEGRHPVVERNLPSGQFVPNDLAADGRSSQILVLTGPNMSGKSTYLRQNALIVVMAQIGSFVPARSARVGAADRVMTRIGSRDRLSRGESTFMVEMRETAAILAAATPRSLLVLDEVGRGTSTYDGISIAWAVLEHLHRMRDATGTGPKVLFATHYFELCALEAELSGVKNLNVQVREWRRPDGHTDVAFLHKIAPGPADRSYGIHVARLAGLPAPAIARAKKILDGLERRQGRAEEHLSRGTDQPALPLFSEHPIVSELKALDPQALTPLQALQILSDLKQRFE